MLKKTFSFSIFFLVITFLVFIFWFQGFLFFASQIPKTPKKLESLTQTDAILVFTGEVQRVSAAIDLLSENIAPRLFISGVNRDITLEDLLSIYKNYDLACCITLDYRARNTAENTFESKKWMKKKGYASAVLVTSGYHMPRSLLHMQRIFPNAEITPYPVLVEKSSSLWKPKTFFLVFAEYNKYMWARIAQS